MRAFDRKTSAKHGWKLVPALCAAAIVFAQTAPAFALPTGAYWYTLYQLPNVWKITKGAGITVAVVDGGVDPTLKDLQGNVLPAITLPGQTVTDPSQNVVPGTTYNHGTDMAVKIAGTGAGAGLVGIAPEAKILPYDVGSGDGTTTDTSLVGPAIRSAVQNGAKIINLSLGGPGTCQSNPDEAAAIKYAYQHGVIVVASAGDTPGPVDAPANCPGALAIGGINSDLTPWTNTPTGPEIDFVAPASNLIDENLQNQLSGPAAGNYGTSSAAAFVSGILALIWSKFPTESARQIVANAIYNAHTGLGTSYIDKRINNTLGYGMPLPYFSLTSPPSADAPNPIYDTFDKELGLTGSGSSSTPSKGGSDSPAPATSKPAVARSSSSSSSTGIIIAAVVVGLLIIGGLIWALTRRSRRTPSGYHGQ